MDLDYRPPVTVVSAGIPTLVRAGTVRTIPEDEQMPFAIPPIIDGVLDIDGAAELL